MAESQAVTDEASAQFGGPDAGVRAIIYVEGLQLGLRESRTFAGVAERIQRSCNLQHEQRSLRFTTKERDLDVRGKTALARRTSLFAVADDDDDSEGDKTHVADLFEVAWSGGLVDRWEDLGRREKLTKSLLGYLMGIKLFLLATFRLMRRQTLKRAGQALIAFAVLATITVYVVGLVGAAVTAVLDWFNIVGEQNLVEEIVVVVTAGLTFFVPALRKKVPTVAAALLASLTYVTESEGRQRLAGRLANDVEALAESGNYGEIHIVAYSMGGIVAFDALFPTGQKPVRALQSVDSLVTIAPPFEAVRAARSTFFDGRLAADEPPRWTNYWAEADVLSSPAPRPKQDESLKLGKGVPIERPYKLPTELTWSTLITLGGLASHGMYWGDDGVDDRNVFDQVVVDLGLDRMLDPVEQD